MTGHANGPDRGAPAPGPGRVEGPDHVAPRQDRRSEEQLQLSADHHLAGILS